MNHAPLSALRLLVLLFAVVGLSAFGSSPLSADAERPADPSYGAEPTTVGDTLMYSVQAGRPLLIALPPRINGESISYRLIEGPALSWLVDRSFMWNTTPQERGELPVILERTAVGMAPDTLVLLIEVTD